MSSWKDFEVVEGTRVVKDSSAKDGFKRVVIADKKEFPVNMTRKAAEYVKKFGGGGGGGGAKGGAKDGGRRDSGGGGEKTWKDFPVIEGTRVVKDSTAKVGFKRVCSSDNAEFPVNDTRAAIAHLKKQGVDASVKNGGGDKSKKAGEKRKKGDEPKKKEKKEKEAPPTAEGLNDDMDAYWTKTEDAPAAEAEAAKEGAEGEEGGKGGKRRKKGEKAPEPTPTGLDDDMDAYWSAKAGEGEAAAAEGDAAAEPAAEEAAEPAAEPEPAP